jgi:hypothetical protein
MVFLDISLQWSKSVKVEFRLVEVDQASGSFGSDALVGKLLLPESMT